MLICMNVLVVNATVLLCSTDETTSLLAARRSPPGTASMDLQPFPFAAPRHPPSSLAPYPRPRQPCAGTLRQGPSLRASQLLALTTEPAPLTRHRKRKRHPESLSISLQLCIVRRARHIISETLVPTHRPPHTGIMHNRRSRNTKRGPKLYERLEKSTRDALFVRQGHTRDEDAARREDKVRAEHAEARGEEVVGPVRCRRVDDRE